MKSRLRCDVGQKKALDTTEARLALLTLGEARLIQTCLGAPKALTRQAQLRKFLGVSDPSVAPGEVGRVEGATLVLQIALRRGPRFPSSEPLTMPGVSSVTSFQGTVAHQIEDEACLCPAVEGLGLLQRAAVGRLCKNDGGNNLRKLLKMTGQLSN